MSAWNAPRRVTGSALGGSSNSESDAAFRRGAAIGLAAKKYDETIRQIKNAGEWPPAGLDYHVCFGSDGNLKVSEIWHSREQFEAFGTRLMPILAGAGIQFASPPDIFEVHNIIKG